GAARAPGSVRRRRGRDPAPGQPRRRRRRGDQRHVLAVAAGRHVRGLRAGGERRARDRARTRRSWQDAPRRGQGKAALQKGRLMPQESYPDDLLYHPEHDWARIDSGAPEHAVLGITWFAQDSLGEVVFFDPPDVGTAVQKDAAYAEVESAKAVSDVISPLSGEIVEVNEALGDNPAMINEEPYGAG